MLLTGMHRSMTSLAARTLNLAGLSLGPEERLHEPDGCNPAGYWEYSDVVDLHDQILHSLGRRWDTALALPAGWLERSAVIELKAELQRIVDRETKRNSVWLLKDPRASLLLPLWQEIGEALDVAVHYVACIRHPLDVANSLFSRDDLPLHHGCAIWLNYNLAILAAAKRRPAHLIAAQDWVEAPAETAASLLTKLFQGASYAGRASRPFPNPVRRDLVHWTRADQQDCHEICPRSAALWEALKQQTTGKADSGSVEQVDLLIQEHSQLSRHYELDFLRVRKEFESLRHHHQALQAEHSQHRLASEEYVADLRAHLARKERELVQAMSAQASQ